ncbi:MAG: hypothetical protein AAB935_01790, partial [Patescibacteria group bacterium]
ANAALKKIKREIADGDFKSISTLDKKLISLDGTKNKSHLGGNLVLGVSIAFARALAAEKNKEVWEILRDEFFKGVKTSHRPLIFSNLINGGAHANNNLAIQEYWVIAKPQQNFNESVKKLVKFYKNLGEFLKKKNNLKNLPIGDEGGYGLNFKNNFEPIQILEKLIFELNLQKEFEIGLDSAASSFCKNGRYQFEGKKISQGELLKVYLNYLLGCFELLVLFV